MKNFILKIGLLILISLKINCVQNVENTQINQTTQNNNQCYYSKVFKGTLFIALSYQLGKTLASFAENDPEVMRIPGAIISGLTIYNEINKPTADINGMFNNKNLALISGICIANLHLKMDCFISPESHFARLLTGIESSLILLKIKNFILNKIKEQNINVINKAIKAL